MQHQMLTLFKTVKICWGFFLCMCVCVVGFLCHTKRGSFAGMACFSLFVWVFLPSGLVLFVCFSLNYQQLLAGASHWLLWHADCFSLFLCVTMVTVQGGA